MEEIPIPEKKGFFHKPLSPVRDASLITDELGSVSRRLKAIEERYINLRRNVQVTDQNMIEHNRRLNAEIKTVLGEINEVKREIFDIKVRINRIITALQDSAKKDEFQVLQKYIALWDPTRFVTQQEVESIVDEILQKSFCNAKTKRYK